VLATLQDFEGLEAFSCLKQSLIGYEAFVRHLVKKGHSKEAGTVRQYLILSVLSSTSLMDAIGKSVESLITRIFGGKFHSTLHAPQPRNSVVVEDWQSLQLDIQVHRPFFVSLVVDF